MQVGQRRAGTHWFELRRSSGNWEKYQEGVLANDSLHRAVCSAAMDGWGNISTGYTRTGSSIPYYPSIYYPGRLSTDPLNTMPYFEYSIQDATNSNTDNERWGDYAGMGVDPADDCTFWFTTEYGGSGQTKIASFKFDSCGCSVPGAPLDLIATPNGDNSIYLQWSQGSPSGVTFNIYRKIGSCPQSNYTKIALNITGLNYTDNTVSGGVIYSYIVKAVDTTGKCESNPSNCDDTSTTGACLEIPSFSGIQSVENAQNSTCTLNLLWNSGSSNCGGNLTYNIYRSTSNPFTPDLSNKIAGNITSTSYSDSTELVYGTTYYYIVRAVDASNGIEETNTNFKSGVPTGPISVQSFNETFEGTGGFDNLGWTHQSLTGTVDWQWSTAQNNTPTHSWFSASQTAISDRVLTTPQFSVLINTTMSFYHTYDFEGSTTSCYDAGTLEYSIDGTNWTVIPDSFFISGGFNGTISSSYGNPIGGKNGWCGGTIGTMTQALINLGSLSGSTIYLRFHAGEDSSYADIGWYVDSVQINNAGTQSSCQSGSACTPPSPPNLNSATPTCDGVNLNYTAGAGQTQSYNIYKMDGNCNGTPLKIDGPLTGTSYLDSSGLGGSTYSYLIKASCASTGTPESNFSNCISVNSYSIPSPTISGNSSNTCPDEFVILSTQNDMSEYQWYKNGVLISGANSSSFQATESANYTVSYSNSYGCSGTSPQFSVTINACMPNIIYLNSTEPIPLEEDGDLIMEAGEKWKMDVTLKNVGEKGTLNVLASLDGEGLIVCGNPINFGNVAINGESTKTFEFIVDPNFWYSTYDCGLSIGFDIISKSSNGGSYTYSNDLNFRTHQVGIAPVNENQSSTALDITNIKNGNKTSNFSPSLTLDPNILSGTVSFSLSGTTNLTNCVKVELIAPDNSASILKDYGQAASSPYNITSFYNLKGSGLYKLKGYELLNCGNVNQFVNINSIQMDLQKQVDGNCTTWSSTCNLPEIQNLKLYKNGSNVNLQFNDQGNFRYNVYVSKTAQTHPFQITGSDYGKKSCDLLSSSIGGNLREISNYDMASGINGTIPILYLLLTVDNGFGTESTLGTDSSFIQRSPSEYCAR